MATKFGTYIPKYSFIHNLNPSLKLIFSIMLIVLVFIPTGFFGLLCLTIIVSILWASSRLPWRTLRGIIKSVLVMFVILFIVNWVAYKTPGMAVDVKNLSHKTLFGSWESMVNMFIKKVPGTSYYCAHGYVVGGNVSEFLIPDVDYNKPTELNKWIEAQMTSGHWTSYIMKKTVADNGVPVYLFYTMHWYTLSTEVIIYTFFVALKMFLIIMIITLLISTTNLVQLTFAIEDILNPLRYIKIPVNEWSMTISIAIRFVPSLLEESQKILKAQASRGVDFSNGNYKDKIKSLVSLVVPMFSIAFHKADDLANAMEARAYNPRYVRTRYRNYAVNWYDWLLFTFLSAFAGLYFIFFFYKMIFAPFNWVEVMIKLG